MGETGLAFHACPPPGHWINDPNGLIFAGGAYRLFAQHRADAPEYRETGWARFSSPDLLEWRFDGPCIPPTGDDWAYSGSVIQTPDGLEAVHTVHTRRLERQARRGSGDDGLSWTAAEDLSSLGPAARNRRDPYVFPDAGCWGLLLAEPCDWTDWQTDSPSCLRRFRSADRVNWVEISTIGPWRPQGIMWEVPLLVRLDGHDVLIVSEVDRRGGGAACAVRAWVGRLTEHEFIPAACQPCEGQLVDFGPDFYALMNCSGHEWPGDPVFVAWASSWQSAREMRWPGFAGGPISLPRALGVEEREGRLRLSNRPPGALCARFSQPVAASPTAGMACFPAGTRIVLEVDAGDSKAVLDFDWGKGFGSLLRTGSSPWTGTIGPLAGAKEVRLFIDGPLVEVFADGLSATFAVAGSAPPSLSATADGCSVAPSWFVLR